MSSRFTESVASAEPGFDFVAAHFQCERNLFSEENPDGYVNFGSAQNFLHPDQVANLLAKSFYDVSDAHYQSFSGTEDCRTAIASFLITLANNRTIQAEETINVDPAHIVVGNGIISVLEALAIALLDAGDHILVPTPVFPGLVNALSVRVDSGVHLLHTAPENDFRLTAVALEQELASYAKEKRIRAILLSSPGNPVGQVFSAAELAEFLAVAKKFGCALIVDEVYAGSCFEHSEFSSAVRLDDEAVYVLGGLSKDFGLAGFATGWLHGTNTKVMKAVARQSHFYRLPAPIQRMVQQTLDPEFAESYLATHRTSLTQRYKQTKAALHTAGVRISEAEAGLCIWMDLRDRLEKLDSSSELAVYEYLLNEHRVHVSPSSGFLTPYRGFYRTCFSHQEANLLEGLKRLRKGLAQRIATEPCLSKVTN